MTLGIKKCARQEASKILSSQPLARTSLQRTPIIRLINKSEHVCASLYGQKAIADAELASMKCVRLRSNNCIGVAKA